MALLRNSLVFLDTRPLSEYTPKNDEYVKLFRYSFEGKVTVCTSWMCIEEWMSQKLEHYIQCSNTLKGDLDNLAGKNFFAASLLDRSSCLKLKSEEDFKQGMKSLLNDFQRESKIDILPKQDVHSNRTWDAFFGGTAPYKKKKQRADIPDSWVYECAIDAAQKYPDLDNKFVVSSENNEAGKLPNFLEKKGFRVISISDLLRDLAEEEARQETPPPQPNQPVTIADSNAVLDGNFGKVLGQFVGTSFHVIATRILGYSHWLKAPDRNTLRQLLQDRGHTQQDIDACSQLLSSGPGGLITLTTNNCIPRNKEICKLAAEQVKLEAIQILQESE